MKEYIERTAVHDLVKSLPKYQMFSYDRTESLTGINPDDVDFGVDKIPAAPVVEVRHGRWIHLSKGDSCSECGFQTGRYESGKNYCPLCGARMDKEDEHGTD